jgi:holin-like protein
MRSTSRSVAVAIADLDQGMLSHSPSQGAQSAVRLMRQLLLVALQLFGLWAFNAAGVWLIKMTTLPVPGNLVGMAALYVLLALGVIKVSWFETTGSFLIRHLAFFFVPITVGLMDAGALFAARGLEIVVVLAVSAGIGIMLAGWISQCLLAKLEHAGDRP